jgi:DNA polymerase-3 subunit alpha
VTLAGDLRASLAQAERSRLKLAGVVLAKQERVSERGRFAFVQLSDPTGQFEVALFSDILAISRELVEGREPLLVEADVRADGDSVKITAQRIEKLDALVDRRSLGIVEIQLADAEAALRVRDLLDGNGQGVRVRLVFGAADEQIVVALPEAFTLAYQRRADLQRQPGFVALRDLVLH